MSILKVADLSRMYGEDRITTWALRDITFTVEEGEFTASWDLPEAAKQHCLTCSQR